MKRYIPIVMSSDANFARYMGIAILSILLSKASGDSLHFFILDGGIADADRLKLDRMVSSYNALITFVPTVGNVFDGLAAEFNEKSHISVATYYRLFVPNLIQEDKCLYIDGDVLVRRSLAPLIDMDIGCNLIAAVKDISENTECHRLNLSSYYNAGILVMDLKGMRQERKVDAFIEYIQNNAGKLKYHDQDVLNSVLQNRIYEIHKIWNCQICKTHACRDKGFYGLRHEAAILHFVGHKKPWRPKCNAPMRHLYWQYLQKSPWAESSLVSLWHRIRCFLTL